MTVEKAALIDKVVYSAKQFMYNQKAGGIILSISVIIALIIANSPFQEYYSDILEYKIGFIFNGNPYFEYSIHHWINDGLMAIFFFVIGLELKREYVGGELANPRKALLPISAAIGGMLVPAVIYLILNPSGEMHNGWGIPMATDIAFALGVLYLLGNKIPLSLKIFLTSLAIVDDLGAVLVIAFFYTSDISFVNLATGLGCALIMFIGNKIGIRNILFYGILGIVGVWASFLLSGIHPTIAAVIAAFTIPADVKIKENTYVERVQKYLTKFKAIDNNDAIPTLTESQLELLEEIKADTKKAIPPLQQLESVMEPFVNFLILPIFALANAGVSLNTDFAQLFNTKIALGVSIGLLFGKVVGVVGFTILFVKLKIAIMPKGMNIKNLFGLGFLASIGFTMSLFITSLAFTNPLYVVQAKIGIFIASIIGGLIGYLTLNKLQK